MDVKYDVHKIFERFPRMDEFVQSQLDEWEAINPAPCSFIEEKPEKPELKMVKADKGFITLQAISSSCAEILVKPTGESGRSMHIEFGEMHELIDALLDLESAMLECHQWSNKNGTAQKALNDWKSKRGDVRCELANEWREAWDEYCNATGVEWCSDCGEIEATKDGYCYWCHPDSNEVLRYSRIVKNRAKRPYLPYLRFVLINRPVVQQRIEKRLFSQSLPNFRTDEL